MGLPSESLVLWNYFPYMEFHFDLSFIYTLLNFSKSFIQRIDFLVIDILVHFCYKILSEKLEYFKFKNISNLGSYYYFILFIYLFKFA